MVASRKGTVGKVPADSFLSAVHPGCGEVALRQAVVDVCQLWTPASQSLGSLSCVSWCPVFASS